MSGYSTAAGKLFRRAFRPNPKMVLTTRSTQSPTSLSSTRHHHAITPPLLPSSRHNHRHHREPTTTITPPLLPSSHHNHRHHREPTTTITPPSSSYHHHHPITPPPSPPKPPPQPPPPKGSQPRVRFGLIERHGVRRVCGNTTPGALGFGQPRAAFGLTLAPRVEVASFALKSAVGSSCDATNHQESTSPSRNPRHILGVILAPVKDSTKTLRRDKFYVYMSVGRSVAKERYQRNSSITNDFVMDNGHVC
ncbi:hypothetical protein Tco_0615941 [Tanacetum coccineum]